MVVNVDNKVNSLQEDVAFIKKVMVQSQQPDQQAPSSQANIAGTILLPFLSVYSHLMLNSPLMLESSTMAGTH